MFVNFEFIDLNSTQKLGSILDHHPPPPQTQWHKYLNCSWPDFNQNLKVGLWDQQQQQHEQHQQQQKQLQQINLDYYLPNLD